MPSTVWDPIEYNHVADFVAKLGEPLIELLGPKPSDHILDLGCGDGSLSVKLKPLCKSLIGIDASEQMVKAAVEKSIDAYVQDAHFLTFQQEFDSVFSNAALHWMKEPERVVKNIYTALKPNGVFVAEFGGVGNASAIVDALEQVLIKRGIPFENPWYFPTKEAYEALLSANGLAIREISIFDRLTPLKGPVKEWISAFGQSFLTNVPEHEVITLLEEVSEKVKDALYINGVWHVDYVRLRVKASKL